MGLTALDMSDMSRLAQLAANPQGTTREEIYLAVASLYRVQGAYLSVRERALMDEILRRLMRDVEMAIRISLAERLADDTTVPHELILLLVDDAIEVARPVILRSPLLTDADALKLIAEADVAYHEAVATRAHIGEPVCDALAKSDAETVLVALVKNATAKIGLPAYETLVEKSRRFATLQEPLVHRPDLPPVLATKMCEWVSDALKTYIVRSYKVAPTAVEWALSSAKATVKTEPPAPRTVPQESATKLIDKLMAGGQLKPGFLLRVLHQGQIDLFDVALAKLLDLDLGEARKRFYDGGPQAVALACRAIAIDKSVFSTVYTLTRQARGMAASLSPAQTKEVNTIFTQHSKLSAKEIFRTF